MKSWRHNICSRCWKDRNPGRVPSIATFNAGKENQCCYCGLLNHDAIFVRENPESENLLCKGEHPE